MISSNYLSSLRASQKPAAPLSGTTPVFPVKIRSLLNQKLVLDESHHHRSRERIADLLGSMHSGSAINLTVGASGAFFQTALALSKNHSVAVIERPYYEPHLAVLRSLGFKIEFWHRVGDFATDKKRIGRLGGLRKALFLSNPHFFTGWTCSQREIDDLSEMFGSLVLDEVHQAQFNPSNEFSIRPRGKNVICIGGLAKSLGLSSLRLGWTSSSEKQGELIRSAGHLIQTEVPTMSQVVGLCALEKRDLILEHIKKAQGRNRSWLRKHVIGKVDLSHDFESGHFGSVSKVEFRNIGLKSDIFGVRGSVRFRIDQSLNDLARFFGVSV